VARVGVGHNLGGKLTTILVDHYFHLSFSLFFFSSLSIFFIEGVLGVDPSPDPIGHFGVPWRPFLILQAVQRCRWLASAPFAAGLVFFFSVINVPHKTVSPIKKKQFLNAV